MGIIESLLQKAKNALLEKLGMRSYGRNSDMPGSQRRPTNVRPASEDPLGDPADQMRGSTSHSSSMPQGRFGNVKPASADPLGDPADQGR